MKVSSLWILSLFTAVAGDTQHHPRDYGTKEYYVLELRSASPATIAHSLGLSYEGELGALDRHYVFSADRGPDDIVKRALRDFRMKRYTSEADDVLGDILFSQKQLPRQPWEKRTISQAEYSHVHQSPQRSSNSQLDEKQRDIMNTLGISDPTFRDQWHLFNPVQQGHDINVTDLWTEGITGKTAIVAVVDDGLDMHSEDLSPNYYPEGSYDFNDQQDEPKPTLPSDSHGTRCAGVVSAARNNVCGVGVAYNSKVAGLRILSKSISDADEAIAITYDFQNNQIFSCSWGPLDNGRTMDGPGILIQRAILKGVQDGRGGLGSIYVFATGNGAANDDNCNFDGYANSIYSITIGAIDRMNQHPYYSEPCSAQLAVTYSSGAGDAIHTTDVGRANCYDGFSGTSAAAPLAAGVYALVLSVRPDLSWRDLQWLQVTTAVPINLDDGDWQDTPLRKFSHTFGYGKVDAYSMVQAAKSWSKVKLQAWYFSDWVQVNQDIPQGVSGLTIKKEVTTDTLRQANLERVEHVTVTMNVNHTRRGDLSVDHVSPAGVVSHIATARKLDNIKAGYENWTFMTVAHWGENGTGNWTLIVKDSNDNEERGILVNFQLRLWGESIDSGQTSRLPMPSDERDETVLRPETHTITQIEPATSTHLAETTPTTPAPVVQSGVPIGEKPDRSRQQSLIVLLTGMAPISLGLGLGFYYWMRRRRSVHRFEPLNQEMDVMEDIDDSTTTLNVAFGEGDVQHNDK